MISVTLEFQIVENPSYDHTMVQQKESRCPWLMTDSIISYPPPLFSVQSFMRKKNEKGLFIYICVMLGILKNIFKGTRWNIFKSLVWHPCLLTKNILKTFLNQFSLSFWIPPEIIGDYWIGLISPTISIINIWIEKRLRRTGYTKVFEISKVHCPRIAGFFEKTISNSC